ncbi:succinylglutamate desuccinylase/aspartoacylase family protein [Enhygromyxa salina]|uniref:Succinylglutamate desuccinylase n=1 Tax=Enhygromyxa salina TaxID=215803 RepID=A0A2S9YRZ6_9BACT|nr:succinylglutamate desuccinylase/aspartoacylase family protein [Enhygromyxa salina]PRQ07857.1 Succinylglutamate desuccinylase [Enhygromyxa salina]
MSTSAPATVVERFEPEELPAGQISRLLLQLAHDGLSRPIELPVLVARGAKPGPILGLTAALHGNELNGIPVIQRLFERLDPKTLRGTVVGVIVVNVPGYLNHERGYGQWDLNHMFPGNPKGNAAAVYVSRLVDRLIRRLNLLVDLHTASVGRVNSLYVRADMTNPEAARIAYLQRPQIIVHNPPSDMTLRGAAAELGIPAVTIEIGNPQRFHSDYIKRTLTGLRAVLADQRMTRHRTVSLGPAPVLCERSHWIYTDHGGLLEVFPEVTEHVEAGQTIARLTTPFGDLIGEYATRESGVVVGHSVNPVAETGARILHVGVPASEGDPRFYPRDPLPASESGSDEAE